MTNEHGIRIRRTTLLRMASSSWPAVALSTSQTFSNKSKCWMRTLHTTDVIFPTWTVTMKFVRGSAATSFSNATCVAFQTTLCRPRLELQKTMWTRQLFVAVMPSESDSVNPKRFLQRYRFHLWAKTNSTSNRNSCRKEKWVASSINNFVECRFASNVCVRSH